MRKNRNRDASKVRFETNRTRNTKNTADTKMATRHFAVAFIRSVVFLNTRTAYIINEPKRSQTARDSTATRWLNRYYESVRSTFYRTPDETTYIYIYIYIELEARVYITRVFKGHAGTTVLQALETYQLCTRRGKKIRTGDAW